MGDLLRAADAAQYAAKRSGRGRVFVADENREPEGSELLQELGYVAVLGVAARHPGGAYLPELYADRRATIWLWPPRA